MRPFRVRRLLLLSGWLLAIHQPAVLAVESMALSTVPESGIAVSIEGWAGITPNTTCGRDVGLLPLVITITNGSSSNRVWTVEPSRGFGNGAGIAPVARLPVPAGEVGRTTLYVDPGPSETAGGVWFSVRGFGLLGGEQRVRIDTWKPSLLTATSGAPSPPIFPAAISRGVFAKRSVALEQFSYLAGVGLDLAAAPEDWRGWSVFSCLLLEESEWIAMSAGQRKAFLDWVGLGGRAGLVVTDPSAERLNQIGLPAADPDGRRSIGAGEIAPLAWDGTQLTPADVAAFVDGCQLHPRSNQLGSYWFRDNGSQGSDRWGSGFRQLFNVFGPRQLPVAAILAFLAVFSVIAGPVNLLTFAGPGRRSRMFWTTPLISLLATLLLLGLIFFRDGVGGVGARRVLCVLMPEQNGMAIIQEQFSRTGVLLGSSFPMREPSWMRPLGSVSGNAGLLEVDGQERRGDWFSSRADQGYLLETVRPSRAKIELVAEGDGPPAVISNIDVPLDRLFVIDADGTYWTATEIGTGERKPLEQSDARAYDEWFRGLLSDAGTIRAAALEAVRNRRGYAYAETREAAAVAVETLGSIRWIDDKALFMGPLTRTTAP